MMTSKKSECSWKELWHFDCRAGVIGFWTPILSFVFYLWGEEFDTKAYLFGVKIGLLPNTIRQEWESVYLYHFSPVLRVSRMLVEDSGKSPTTLVLEAWTGCDPIFVFAVLSTALMALAIAAFMFYSIP